MTVRGAILAGGQANRMGGVPKGLLEVGGRRILDRIAEAMIAAFDAPPLLVANAVEAPAWRSDLVVVPDLVAGAATLGGILTAVIRAPAPVVCVAWDMPFLTPPLLRRLADGLTRADVVLPASGGPRGVEPLAAGYGPASEAPIRAAIARGDLRAVAVREAVRTEIVTLDEVARFGDPARLFLNVNDPADLARARACAG